MVLALSALPLNFLRYGNSSLFTKSTRSSPVIALWSTFPFLSFGAAQVIHLNFDSIIQQTFKNIDDILHKDAGCGSELDYVEQTSWILFLKYLDDLEKDKETAALLSGKTYERIIESKFRWVTWAAPKLKNGNTRSVVFSSVTPCVAHVFNFSLVKMAHFVFFLMRSKTQLVNEVEHFSQIVTALYAVFQF
jgi:hypothetical protein